MAFFALDFDDTLVDTLAVLQDWMDATYGYRVDEERLATFQLGAERSMTTAIMDRFWADIGAHEGVVPVEGAVQACQALALGGHRLAVVTSRNLFLKDTTHTLVDRLFPGIFSEVILTGEKREKTSTLRELGVSLLVDDNPRFIREAQIGGIPAVLFGDLPWNRHEELSPRASDWSKAQALLALGL